MLKLRLDRYITSREYGERPTLPSPRQEVCTTYDACRPAMHVNIHLPTVLNGEYFHPTKSHCIFMCILGLHPRDMAPVLVVNAIHHIHIDHNAPSLSPKIYITIVPNFSWVLQSSQEKSKTTVMKNLEG